MSDQKLIVPGFGIGTVFGVPTTVGLAPTSTLSIANTATTTVVPRGFCMATGIVTGVQLQAVSTTNGVTGTWNILNGAPGAFFNGGSTMQLVNTTTSATIVFITP